MDAKLKQEIERVLAEANQREFSQDIQPYFTRTMSPNEDAWDALVSTFQDYLASCPPIIAMIKAFTYGQAWQRVADEAELARQ
jgi:hypothetical protein